MGGLNENSAESVANLLSQAEVRYAKLLFAQISVWETRCTSYPALISKIKRHLKNDMLNPHIVRGYTGRKSK